jgi:hypothetical protein
MNERSAVILPIRPGLPIPRYQKPNRWRIRLEQLQREKEIQQQRDGDDDPEAA